MTEIATAFVRLRPVGGTQFQAEARREVQSGLRNALAIGAGVTGGVIAVDLFRDLGRAIKGAAQAAAEEEVRADLLAKAVDNAGAAHRAFGQDIETLIDKESRLKGFTDQELSSAFARLVQATGDTELAFKDLGLAEDVARIRKIDLGNAAIALAKAEQGSTTALARLGIIIPKVHTEVAALTKRHDEAVAAGAKFSKSQELIYKAALTEAAGHDKVADRLKAREVVQQRFGGSSARFAETTSGQFARLGVAVNEFEESLGKDLLPPLADAAEGLAHVTQQAQNSEDIIRGVHETGQLLGSTLEFIGDAARTVGPPLLDVAHGIESVTTAIGAPALVTGFLAFKSINVAIAAGGGVQAAYTKAVQAGTAASAENAAAQTAQGSAATRTAVEYTGLTTAVAANTAALEANVAASRLSVAGFSTVQFGSRAAKTELAALGAAAGTAEVKMATAARGGFSTFTRGIGTLALGAVGGTTGAAVIGLAALAGGVAYLATKETDTERATRNLKTALDNLGDALNQTKELANQVAQSNIDVALAKDAKAAADAAVDQAEANERATRGTNAHSAAVLALKTARDQDKAAALAVTQAEDRARQAANAKAKNEKNIQQDRQDELRTTIALLEHEQNLGVAKATIAGVGTGDRAFVDAGAAENAQRSAIRLAETLNKNAADLQAKNPGLAASVRLLAQYTTAVQRVPTKAETKFILDPSNAKRSLRGIVEAIRAEAINGAALARTGGTDIGRALAEGIPVGMAAATPPVFSAVHSLISGTVAAGKTAAEARSPSARTAREIGLPIGQGIAIGIETSAPEVSRALSDTVGDAIKQGGAQVGDAINQAKQNLNSIGQGLASTIGTFIDQGPLGQQITALQNKLTARQTASQGKQLQDQVRAAQKALADAKDAVDTGGPVDADTRRGIDDFLKAPRDAVAQAKAALADFRTQQRITALQSKAEDLKTSTTRGIADITDEVNRGLISVPEANRRIAAILAKDDIDYRRAGKSLGIAFADSYLAQLQGLRSQMVALVGAPRLPGSGLVPSIVRPIDTLKDVTRSIAQAQRERDEAAAAQRKETNQHLKDIKGNTLAADFIAGLGSAAVTGGKPQAKPRDPVR